MSLSGIWVKVPFALQNKLRGAEEKLERADRESREAIHKLEQRVSHSPVVSQAV